MIAFGFTPGAQNLLRPRTKLDNGVTRPSRTSRTQCVPRASVVVPLKNRLLPASVASPAPLTFAFRERFLFWVGEFLMWNPGAKILTLLLITLASVALGSLLFRAADPKRVEAQSPFWHATRAVANPLEDDWNSVPLRTVSVVLASVGMVVFAILVGMVTDSVQNAVQNADGGDSRLYANQHTLVLGYSSRIPQTLRDLASVTKRERVVILAPADERETLMQEIKAVLKPEERRKLRLLYRQGIPVLSQDLERVSARNAGKIVLVNEGLGTAAVQDETKKMDADRKVLARALALSHIAPDFKGDVVAELNSSQDIPILKKILKKTGTRSVEVIHSEKLLFRFMAQAVRQPGLANVVATQLMGKDDSTVFHVDSVSSLSKYMPGLAGKRYSDILPTSIKGCLIVGYFDEDYDVDYNFVSRKVVLASPGHGDDGPVLTENTKLLLVGHPTAPKTSGPYSEVPRVLKDGTAMEAAKRRIENKGTPESFLVCGWRPNMTAMLEELDDIVPKGSRVVILDDDAPERVSMKLKRLNVRCIVKRPDVLENLEDVLLKEHFDNVILLGSALGIDDKLSTAGTDEDSKALATWVYVNKLIEQKQEERRTFITLEFNSPEVADVAQKEAGVANALLPLNLGAKISAQTLRDPKLNSVWAELLEQDGKEVYLSVANKFVDVGTKMSFKELADKAAVEQDDTVIGFIPKGLSPNVNPTEKDRNEPRIWSEDDFIIVISQTQK